MKKLKFIVNILVFILPICSINIYSQMDQDEKGQFKIGVGIDLEFPGHDIYPVPPTNLILTMDIYNSLRIEPGIGFNYREEFVENSLDEKSKQIRFSLGTFWVINFKKISTYLGVQFDNAKTKREYFHIDPDAETIQNQFRVGPLVGLEYKFANKFSVGGEFILFHAKTKTHYTDFDSDQEMKTKSWKTTNSIKFRFYF